MTILTITPQAPLVAALVAGDLTTLKALVAEQGLEASLTYRFVRQDHDEDTDIEVSSTALGLATYLRQEDLALWLVAAGAMRTTVQVSLDGSFGWSEQVVIDIEQATSFGLARLSKAMMEATPCVNWSARSCFDNDSLPARRHCEPLFEGLQDSRAAMRTLEEAGLFRGLLKGHLVCARKEASGWATTLDGKLLCVADSLKDSLYAIRRRIVLESAIPPAPDDDEDRGFLEACDPAGPALMY